MQDGDFSGFAGICGTTFTPKNVLILDIIKGRGRKSGGPLAPPSLAPMNIFI